MKNKQQQQQQQTTTTTTTTTTTQTNKQTNKQHHHTASPKYPLKPDSTLKSKLAQPKPLQSAMNVMPRDAT
jgi:hypothetical protein